MRVKVYKGPPAKSDGLIPRRGLEDAGRVAVHQACPATRSFFRKPTLLWAIPTIGTNGAVAESATVGSVDGEDEIAAAASLHGRESKGYHLGHGPFSLDPSPLTSGGGEHSVRLIRWGHGRGHSGGESGSIRMAARLPSRLQGRLKSEYPNLNGAEGLVNHARAIAVPDGCHATPTRE